MATTPLSIEDVRSGGLPVNSMTMAKHDQKRSIECMGTADDHPKYRTVLHQVQNSRCEAAPSPRKSCMEATTETQTETIEEKNIKLLWRVLQVAEGQREKRGLQFGKAMYEYREKHSAQGRRTDLVTMVTKSETFEEFCDRLGIVRMTAYRWIAKYEESIGTRLPKPTPDNDPNKTTSYEVRVGTEPTAQASSGNVSPSEDSSSIEDDLLPESEPEPNPPTHTPVVSHEERDREELRSYLKRLNSISIALQQVVNGKAKWTQYAEYDEVKSAGKKFAGLVNLM